jgi:hypothetical protein
MKLANLIAAGAALTAGLAGGTATYLVAAQPAPSSETPPVRTTEVSATSPVPAVAPGKPIVKLAPCKPPAVREGKACVTDLVETVVLPARSSGSAGVAAGGGFQSTGHDSDDDADHDGDDDGSEATGHVADEGEDHAGGYPSDGDHAADDDDTYEDEDHADEDEDHADEDQDHADEDQDHADEDQGQDD